MKKAVHNILPYILILFAFIPIPLNLLFFSLGMGAPLLALLTMIVEISLYCFLVKKPLLVFINGIIGTISAIIGCCFSLLLYTQNIEEIENIFDGMHGVHTSLLNIAVIVTAVVLITLTLVMTIVTTFRHKKQNTDHK